MGKSQHFFSAETFRERPSCLPCSQAQRFLATVLLPHVRQDIRENRRLHFALFQSLKKAAYKPDAFFKVRTCSRGVCVAPMDGGGRGVEYCWFAISSGHGIFDLKFGRNLQLPKTKIHTRCESSGSRPERRFV